MRGGFQASGRGKQECLLLGGMMQKLKVESVTLAQGPECTEAAAPPAEKRLRW